MNNNTETNLNNDDLKSSTGMQDSHYFSTGHGGEPAVAPAAATELPNTLHAVLDNLLSPAGKNELDVGGWREVSKEWLQQIFDAGAAAASLAASVAQPGAELAIPDELRRIGRLLSTQDEEYTAHAMFVVEQERVLTGVDTDYDPDIVWLIEDSMIFKGDDEFDALEAAYEADGTVPENYTRTGYTKHWDFVTAFLTREAAEDFVAKHAHKYSGPLRFTVECEHRNMEWRFLREWLLSLAAPAAQVQAQPDDRKATFIEARRELAHIGNYLDSIDAPREIKNRTVDLRACIGELAETPPAAAPAEQGELPPLPKEFGTIDVYSDDGSVKGVAGYTADQMRGYAIDHERALARHSAAPAQASAPDEAMRCPCCGLLQNGMKSCEKCGCHRADFEPVRRSAQVPAQGEMVARLTVLEECLAECDAVIESGCEHRAGGIACREAIEQLRIAAMAQQGAEGGR